MTLSDQLVAGFSDPVHDAQSAFRCALNALARPGQPVALGRPVDGVALGAAMSHLLLALSDDDTPVWWQKDDAAVVQWLRFHTGAPRSETTAGAAFAVVLDAADVPALDAFASGSIHAPDSSATLLVEVPSFDSGPVVAWRGPGIRETQLTRLAGLPEDFWHQWQASHASFPQGIDIIFSCAGAALGLPRTTRVRRLEGI